MSEAPIIPIPKARLNRHLLCAMWLLAACICPCTLSGDVPAAPDRSIPELAGSIAQTISECESADGFTASALDAEGNPSGEVFRWAFLNSLFQSGLTNPLDEAVLAAPAAEGTSAEGYEKLDEIPYDFVRKRLSVLVASPDGGRFLVTKGALRNVLDACTSVNRGGTSAALDDATKRDILERFASWSTEGYRVIGVARKAVEDAGKRQDESDLEFLGFLRFSDPPSEGVSKELEELRSLGVRLKLITGDNRYVARHVAARWGSRPPGSSPARNWRS